MCISTYALNTFSWLLLREVPVAVGDTLRRDPKVSGWQADQAARAGWSAVFWGWDSQEDVRSWQCAWGAAGQLCLEANTGISEEEGGVGRHRL